MELHGKAWEVLVSYTLAGLIVRILVGNLANSGIKAVAYHCIAVVLGGNECPVKCDINNRLVCTSVTVLELFALCAVGKSHELMTEADSENGYLTFLELFQVLNNICILSGVAGAV